MDTLFKRILIFGTTIMVGAIIINSCVSTPVLFEQENIQAEPTTLPLGQVVSQDNWQFVLTEGNWIERSPAEPAIKAVFKRSTPYNVSIIFTKEEVNTNLKYYILNAVHSFTEYEFIPNVIKTVVINGQTFISMQVVKEDQIIIDWITIKDNFGYSLTCAVELADADSPQYILCETIAQTMEIQ